MAIGLFPGLRKSLFVASIALLAELAKLSVPKRQSSLRGEKFRYYQVAFTAERAMRRKTSAYRTNVDKFHETEKSY